MGTVLTETENPRRELLENDLPNATVLGEPLEGDLPDAAVLEDRFPEWLQVSRRVAGGVCIVGLLFVFLNYRPLWHTDLWGHLTYGRFIWESGGIPETEPLMPLSQGVPFVDTAWLSQLIGYGLDQAFGVSGLQFLYALSVTFCAGLLFWSFQKRTENWWISLTGLALFTWVEWQQLAVVRPQLAGMICFVSLFVLLIRSPMARRNWILVPVLFVFWVNLHGSFPVGLGLLACFCLGRAIDVVRRTRRLSSMFYDRRTRRYFLLTELAAVAVLLNPYGLAIYAETVSLIGHSNLSDIIEWQPLQFRMAQGQAAAVAALALMFVYRLSPRRIRSVEVLLLVGLGCAALWTSRMLAWWVPVATYCFVLHAGAIWKRLRQNRLEPAPSPCSGKWTVITLTLVWIFFAITPLAGHVLHGREMPLTKSLSEFTPVGAVKYLNEHPPKGQVFNSYEWGDYLLWAGPKDIQVFVASHAHLVPTEVWRHYMQVIQLGAGWETTLDRYSVNTVVVDKLYRNGLIRSLKMDSDWRLAFEDDRSAVLVRRTPI